MIRVCYKYPSMNNIHTNVTRDCCIDIEIISFNTKSSVLNSTPFNLNESH